MARGIKKGTKLGKWSQARKDAWRNKRWGVKTEKVAKNESQTPLNPSPEPITKEDHAKMSEILNNAPVGDKLMIGGHIVDVADLKATETQN